MIKRSLWLGLLGYFAALLLAAGCTAAPQPTPSPAPTETLPPTLTVSATPQPTFTQTLTASPTPLPPVRFAVIGDYGLAGDPEAAVAALVDSWDVDFILTTGDNNYPGGSARTIDKNIGQYYHAYIYPYTGEYGEGADVNRFFPSLGNHDWRASGAKPYLEYFTLPGNERYYQLTWGAVDIFVVDSEWNEPDGVAQDSVQAQWLQQALADSKAAWKVICFHYPPYSSGHHGPTVSMRWPFAEWGADAVLSGHDHHYERLEEDGLVYFVNGLGGGARYAIESLAPGSQVRYRDQYGAMLVEADAERMSFSFITIDGDLIDHFELAKGD